MKQLKINVCNVLRKSKVTYIATRQLSDKKPHVSDHIIAFKGKIKSLHFDIHTFTYQQTNIKTKPLNKT